MRYFLHLAYNGCNYRGWQRQLSAVSVQECLENALSQIFKQKITCIGCGRTDAVVHAIQYFVHFDLENDFDFDLLFRLQKTLPHDIVVFDVFIMINGAEHARYDAVERTYNYFIHTNLDPFLHTVSSYYDASFLDLNSMKEALLLLLKYNDFAAFCLTPDKHNTTLCKITAVQLYTNKNNNRFRIEISANRFLKGMIRIIVGKLLEIGAGRLTIGEFEELFISKNRAKIMNSAYPQGLYLSKIRYPYLDIPIKTEFWNIFNGIEWVEV